MGKNKSNGAYDNPGFENDLQVNRDFSRGRIFKFTVTFYEP